MQELDRRLWPQLETPEERSCALLAAHTLATGAGAFYVDRWPDPRATACFSGGNLLLYGEASGVASGELGGVIATLREEWDHVFIQAPDAFAGRLREEVRELQGWPRIMFTGTGPGGAAPAPDWPAPRGARVARLTPTDLADLEALSDDIEWIADTHGGPEGLARSGLAVGLWAGGRLVSVAATFFVGKRYEELGVVTEAQFRGRGASPCCSAALIRDIRQRRRIPCWSTTPANLASQRVAEKLGLRREREELHYVAGAPLADSIAL